MDTQLNYDDLLNDPDLLKRLDDAIDDMNEQTAMEAAAQVADMIVAAAQGPAASTAAVAAADQSLTELLEQLPWELPPTTTTGGAAAGSQSLQGELPSMQMHNNVYVTDPCVVDSFFKNPASFSEADLADFRNVSFDTKQSGHAYARMACHTMKTLYLVNQTFGIPLSQLMLMCGSDESYRCQAVHKDGRCSQKAVAGFFFCGLHRKLFSHQEGAMLLQKRRAGIEVEHGEGDASGSKRRKGNKAVA